MVMNGRNVVMVMNGTNVVMVMNGRNVVMVMDGRNDIWSYASEIQTLQYSRARKSCVMYDLIK